jgi:hypothetical protein
MDRRISAGIAVAVALAVGVFLFMLARQRAMTESAARAALAEVQRLAEEARGRGNQAIAEAREPRWPEVLMPPGRLWEAKTAGLT